MTTATEKLPPLRPLQRHAQLETDCFCDCGYNLHGQVVTRDERLGFFICRCPECGQFHPAGAGTSASKVWLNRLGTVALVYWVMFVLAFFGFGGFLLGVMQAIYVETGTEWVQTTDDGRRIEYRSVAPGGSGWYIVGSDELIDTTKSGITSGRVQGPVLDWNAERDELTVLVLVTLLIAIPMGLFFPAALWHLRRRHHLWLLLLPPAATLIVAGIWWVDDGSEMGTWSLKRAALMAAFQMVVLYVATWFGRPVARAVVWLIVPPKPRRHLAFLWEVDGKTPPALAEGRPF